MLHIDCVITSAVSEKVRFLKHDFKRRKKKRKREVHFDTESAD